MPVTGDPSQISKLQAKISRMIGVPVKAAVRFAPVLKDFIKEEFATGTDPFGDPWKPLKATTVRKGRTPPPLTATGNAVNVMTVTASGARDRASFPNYIRYHLSTGRSPLPLRGEVWPAKWLEAIKAAAAAVIKAAAEGR